MKRCFESRLLPTGSSFLSNMQRTCTKAPCSSRYVDAGTRSLPMWHTIPSAISLPATRLFASSIDGPSRTTSSSTKQNSGSTSPDADGCDPTGTTVSSQQDRLVDWVIGSGGRVNGVEVFGWGGKDGGSGLGLRCTRAIQMGEELVELPAQCQLSHNETSDGDALTALIQKVPQELWGGKLALKLLYHRLAGEKDSFWPYIANLPIGFSGVPLFFDAESIALLEYPPVSHQIVKRCRWLVEFSKILADAREGDQYPFGDAVVDANLLGWALAAVTSRAFQIRLPGGESRGTMLPLIDMCNHSFNANAKVVSSGSDGRVKMLASKEIQAGEPVLLSYGTLPNDFFLLDYGFIVSGNPYDTVKLRFDVGFIQAAQAVSGVEEGLEGQIDKIDAPPILPQWQQKALNTILGSDTEVYIRASSEIHSSPVDPKLLGGVRVLCCAEKDEVASVTTDWDTPLRPISREVSALKTLLGVCIIALSQFSCSLADDLKTQAASTGDKQLAVGLRAGKKQILSDAMVVLKTRLQDIEQGKSIKTKKKSKKVKSTKGFGN